MDCAGTAREGHLPVSTRAGAQTTRRKQKQQNTSQRQLSGDRGKLALQAPAPGTALAPLSVSQAEPGPQATGDGKTCVQPRKQHLAGDTARGTARGPGKRKDRQASSEMRQTDGRGGRKDQVMRGWRQRHENLGKCTHGHGCRQRHGESQVAVRRIPFPR